ncbi:MAG TPA: DUF4388 domain-containing protein [Anaeromyxobacter sp.]|nr:DUF4388 domain-containing protein [Anaeromyxobacter sp.]
MTAPLSGKRLLLVGEDPELLGLVEGATSRLGAEVGRAGSGREALEALARGGHQLAVLDLPLSDLGTPEALVACARAGLPAVVVSGAYRGPKAAAELRRLGARTLLEKPFSLDALAGAVAEGVGVGAPSPVEEEAPDEVTGARPLPGLDDAAIAASPIPALDDQPVPAAPAPRAGLAAPLPELPRVRSPEADAPPPARGDLARSSVPRLLVALHVGQATGALSLTRGPVRKIVVVERGNLVYAASNLAPERFAGICVRRGVVEAERLEALRREAAPGARTAEILAGAGLLTPERRAELVTGQVRAVTWSTFEWREGTYAFQPGRPPAGRVPLALDAGDVVLEGLRRTASLGRLREELPADAHLAPSPAPAFELYDLRLAPEEARLLTLADGTKSVADLTRLSELPERDALAFLQACRVLRVLDEVERVLASTRRMGFM